MTLVYLHGFASDGEGWKARALRKHFPSATVFAPDLPADPQLVYTLLLEALSGLEGPLYLFGTSLGGFYTLLMSAYFQLPSFLFNPSIRPHTTLKRGIGEWTTFQKKRPYHFKSEYLITLGEQRRYMLDRIDQQQLHFFLATDDAILDLSTIEPTFPQAVSFRWHNQSGHVFTTFEKALKEIKQAGWISLSS